MATLKDEELFFGLYEHRPLAYAVTEGLIAFLAAFPRVSDQKNNTSILFIRWGVEPHIVKAHKHNSIFLTTDALYRVEGV